MSWILKILGSIIILFVSTFGGVLKSKTIKDKAQNLKNLIVSLKQLGEYIKIDGGEIKILLNKCFNDEVFMENGKICFNKNLYEREITELLSEYFSGLGKKDKASEYERTNFYIKLLENRLELQEGCCEKLCKLYNSLGFFCGLLICIFLM